MKPSPFTSTSPSIDHQHNTPTDTGTQEELTHQGLSLFQSLSLSQGNAFDRHSHLDITGPFEESPHPFIILETSNKDQSAIEDDNSDGASLFPPELAHQIIISPPPPPRRSLLRAVTRSFSRSRSRDQRDRSRLIVQDGSPLPVPPLPVLGGIPASNTTHNPSPSNPTTSPTSPCTPAPSKSTVFMKQFMRRTTALLRLRKLSNVSLDTSPTSPTSLPPRTPEANTFHSLNIRCHDPPMSPNRRPSRIRASTLPNRAKPALKPRGHANARNQSRNSPVSTIRPIGNGANRDWMDQVPKESTDLTAAYAIF